jgi:hypothetical protein
MDSFDIKSLALDPATLAQCNKRKPRTHASNSERWLAGPIPMPWLHSASKLGGKALWMGNILWHLRGLTRRTTFIVSNVECKRWGFNRQTKYRCLARLAGAGLIEIDSKSGASTKVTLLLPE